MIKIITDTSCDLPQELVDRYGILLLPMNITFGEDTFADRETITCDQFYQRLVQGGEFPKTSYPSLGRLQMLLDAELAAGNEIIIITIARPLSGFYDSVRILLEDYPQDKVAVFDSKSATLGEGAIVLAAARLAAAGATYDEVKAALPAIIERSRGYGAINDLVYLAKGGRINGAVANVARALNIKPVINICPDGSLEVAQKVRGMHKALSWIADRVKQDGVDFSQTTLFVSYILQKDSAEKLLAELQATMQLGEVILCPIGPTVGVHLGPGCVALFYLTPTQSGQ